MSESCKINVERRGDVAVFWTDGYINNQGGEEIARQAYAQLDAGARALVLNLEKTRIVNSIGISILIEVLEKVMDRKGVLAFCNRGSRPGRRPQSPPADLIPKHTHCCFGPARRRLSS